jgi:hypothetical protein
VLVRGFKNLSEPKIPHASSASRSYPLLQRLSGTRADRPLAQYVRPVSPVTAGRSWPLSLELNRPYHRLAATPASRRSVGHRP